MEVRVPFLPLGEKRARAIARHYLGWGEKITGLFGSLDRSIEQARFPYEPREWAALSLYSLISYFSLILCILFLVTSAARMPLLPSIGISLLSALSVSFFVFFIQLMYPKVFLKRKVRSIEKNLPFALHHLLIHVRSGVTLFGAMVSISKSGYGPLSKEFQKVVAEVNTGKSEVAALETMARENPSLHLRRVLWHIVNALKAGADVGATIKEIVENMVMEQRSAIKKYGSELNPLALFYMMLVVIFPTMGIIFLMVLFSFIGSSINIQLVLGGILAAVILAQIMFIGLIKAKRPGGV